MKKITSIIILLSSFICFSQTAIKFIDSESKLPISEIYSTIYKNEDTFENCGGSNKKGIYKIKIRELDNRAKYYLQFNDNLNYKPIWKEINTKRKDTLKIYLKRSRFFYDTSEDLLKSICGTYSFKSIICPPINSNFSNSNSPTRSFKYFMVLFWINSGKSLKLVGSLGV